MTTLLPWSHRFHNSRNNRLRLVWFFVVVVASIVVRLPSAVFIVAVEGKDGQEARDGRRNNDDGYQDGGGTCDRRSDGDDDDDNDGIPVHNSNDDDDDDPGGIDCDVYMAPSTVGDHSNLGMYTAKRMVYGDVVPYPEMLIPFLWRTFGDHPKRSRTDGVLWDRYIWEQHVGEMNDVFDDYDPTREKASCFVPGVGCTVNSMLDLSNIRSAQGSTFDELVQRDDPVAGSFTPYHSVPTIVSVATVDPGQELFASYGDSWIPWIPNAPVTQTQHLDKADELMSALEGWIKEHEVPDCSTREEVTDQLLEGMWNFIVHDFPQRSRPLSVLPKEWNRTLLKAASAKENQLDVGFAQQQQQHGLVSPTGEYWRGKGKVSLAFLKEHGKCQDHIRPGTSTINAGRGAFATRDLPKGTVVGYAPLVHVAVRGEEILTVDYDGINHGSKDLRKNNYSRPDLVLNYSFGHRNSTLLLTPYGAMVNYINHKSPKRNSSSSSDDDDDDQRNNDDGPNVRIQWPAKELIAHKPKWLTEDIHFLRDTIDKIGLSFDYVALRDIKAGEEIFMDYGDGWVQAWEEHVSKWSPPDDADGYVHSSNFKKDRLLTPHELQTNPYPWNLHTLCSRSFKASSYDGSYTYSPIAKNKIKERLPCRVLERIELKGGQRDKFVYTVEIDLPSETIIAKGFPRQEDGIDLYDKAYSQMWHMEDAFRHKMYIPDDMFPETWMNKK